MNEEETVNQLSSWFSTYGVITAQRLLEGYRIRLKDVDLIYALKTPNTFYNRLLRIPLKNVFNGIIMQQVREYQVYSQKLFVDYLLSGEDSKIEEAPGADTRDAIELKRKALIALGNDFHQQEIEHEKLVAESQATLIKDADAWQKKINVIASKLKQGFDGEGVSLADEKIKKALLALLTQYDFKDDLTSIQPERWQHIAEILGVKVTPEMRRVYVETLKGLSEFADQSEEAIADYGAKVLAMNNQLREYRGEFSRLIVQVTDLCKRLPDFKFNPAQTTENLSQLYFNASLGDEQVK